MPQAHIIAIAHHAGGVGKTTTALNLGYALAQAGRPVTVVDLDPQADLSRRLGVTLAAPTLADVLTTGRGIPYAHALPWGVDIIPSDIEQMAGVEMHLASLMQGREQRLARALAAYRETPGAIVLLDCPPSISLLTINALYAADSVLIPVQAHDKGVRQLTPLFRTLDEVHSYRPGGLPTVLGLLLTMVDNTNQASEAERDLRASYPAWMFDTTIPVRTVLRDDGRYHAPVGVYASQNASALAYAHLAQEVLARVQ